jgi:exosortase A-associated hydrolase 1
VFACEGEELVGIVHVPERPSQRGVVIVVGGPQYRVGSHRQFVLLARELARRGHYTLRFDYRGMGDSSGMHPSFEQIQPDIRSAIDALFATAPLLTNVVIWGLCDAASAALMYAHRDARVSGLVLLNPWVHDPAASTAPHLRTYYLKRLGTAAFWTRLITGKIDVLAPLRMTKPRTEVAPPRRDVGRPRYQVEMQVGASKFAGRVLVVLSGEDLVAAEFKSLTQRERKWRAVIKGSRWSVRELTQATHTFSREEWRNCVADWTAEWLSSW